MKVCLKLFLGSTAGVVSAMAVSPIIASCSNKTVINRVHQCNLDKTYGLNENTYKLLKKDYETKYTNSLVDQGIQKGSELWESRMNTFKTCINHFDNNANSKPVSYAQLTSSLIEYAKSVNGIQLRRITNAKWSDVDAVFRGAYDSFDLYMTHEHFSEKQKTQILNDAAIKFNAFVNELETQGYKENDPFGAIEKVRCNLLVFFDSVNDRIARLAAYNIIQNFLIKYSISYRKNYDKSYISSIRSKLKVGESMSSYFNDLFDIYDRTSNTKVTFHENLMVPGYVVMPVLGSLIDDPKFNYFEIKVEWHAVKQTIFNSGDATRIKHATAYMIDPYVSDDFKQKILNDDPITDDNEVFAFLDSYKKGTFTYNLNDTNANEQDSIKRYFFNDQNGIYLKWADSNDSHANLLPFIQNAINCSEFDVGTTGYLDTADLMAAGLQLKCKDAGDKFYDLSDIVSSFATKTLSNGIGKEAPDQYHLFEEFIQSVGLLAKFEVVDRIGEKFTIKTQFFAKYDNSSVAGNKDGFWEIPTQFTAEATYAKDYPINKQSFKAASNSWSIAKRKMDFFTEQNGKVSGLISKMSEWIFGISAAFALTASLVVLLIYKLATGTAGGSSIGGFLAAGLVFINGSLALKSLVSIDHEVEPYLEKIKNIEASDVKKELEQKIKDAGESFVYIDEKGNYDRELLDSKFLDFLLFPLERQVQMINFFRDLYSAEGVGKRFDQAIENAGITTEKTLYMCELLSTNNSDFVNARDYSIALAVSFVTLVIVVLCNSNKKRELSQTTKDNQPWNDDVINFEDDIDEIEFPKKGDFDPEDYDFLDYMAPDSKTVLPPSVDEYAAQIKELRDQISDFCYIEDWTESELMEHSTLYEYLKQNLDGMSNAIRHHTFTEALGQKCVDNINGLLTKGAQKGDKLSCLLETFWQLKL